MKRRLLIIPARSGSKRIKLKNIKKFNNRPIISYSIKEANKSKLFDTIHVSTDDYKIKKVADKISNGITHLRPKYLSTSTTPLFKVFDYIVKKYTSNKQFFEEIWFLNPCSPLIKSKDLKNASIFFKNQKNNSLLSVCKYSPPIEWAFELKEKTIIPLDKKSQKKKSQTFSDKYYDTGNFGIFSKNVFYKNHKIKFSGFVIERSKSVDIDTIEDWNLALILSK